ncbi:MAG: lysozyme inhibitor LprI family protein [Cyclobacteriaceae bacterium]
MRVSLILAFLVLSILSYAQTQSEISKQADKDFREVDQKLNDVYRQILYQYKSDTAFIQNLKSSQRIWIQFRGAELKVKFPDRETGVHGSIHPTCKTLYVTELTKERIDRLRTWIEGSEEGDICAGSVMRK